MNHGSEAIVETSNRATSPTTENPRKILVKFILIFWNKNFVTEGIKDFSTKMKSILLDFWWYILFLGQVSVEGLDF